MPQLQEVALKFDLQAVARAEEVEAAEDALSEFIVWLLSNTVLIRDLYCEENDLKAQRYDLVISR